MAGTARGKFQGYFDQGADRIASRLERFNMHSNKESLDGLKQLHGFENKEMNAQTQHIDEKVGAMQVEIQQLEMEIEHAKTRINDYTGQLEFMNNKIEHKKSKCQILDQEMRALSPK